MNAVNLALTFSFDTSFDSEVKIRRAAEGKNPSVFTDIYLEETNIVVWQRELSKTLKESVDSFLESNSTFQASMTVTPESALSSVNDSFNNGSQLELSENIAELVDMFCCLFELKRVGLRLSVLDRAMCPKFHVDRVPCRLITTFQGAGTEWLPHAAVNRKTLGAGPISQDNLFENQDDIQSLHPGDVALLKGENWQGNENAGLVHRSPALLSDERRLILTLDFSH